MAWFAFMQNNSGGYYMIDDVVSEYVMVEETTVKKAIKKAKSITKNHRKYCDCCGKRWDFREFYIKVLDEQPTDYDQPTIVYFANGDKSIIQGANQG